MKQPILATLVLLASTFAFAQGPAASADCAARAVSKDGKPLAGAAKTAFMKKCQGEAAPAASAKADCESRAVGKNGKPLAGAAKTAFVKKCEQDAQGAK